MFAVTSALARTGQPFVQIDDSNDGHVRPAVTVGRDGRLAVFASWGQSIAGLPLYAIGSGVATFLGPDEGLIKRIFTGWTGSVATALGAAIFFLLCRRLGAATRWALILTAAYSIGTFAWPHSKTFFSEPMTTTLIMGAWYLAVDPRPTKKTAMGAGLLAATSLLFRTTTFVMIPPIAVWLAISAPGEGRWLRRAVRQGMWFALGSAGPVAAIALSNSWRFGHPAKFGYPPPTFDIGGLPTGLYGLFFSPGKSLFLFAPMALVGIAALTRVQSHRLQLWLMFSSAMTSALLFAAYIDWHGDHAWGPRYLVMSLPLMLLALAQMPKGWWRRAVVISGLLGSIVSLLGVIISFNAYFIRAAGELPQGYQPGTDDLLYWRYTHFDPYWSQVAGHARYLPFTLKQTAQDALKPRMGPFPSTPDEIYDWYLAAPLEADSWTIWVRQARGPMELLVLAPVFMFGAVFAARRAWRLTEQT